MTLNGFEKQIDSTIVSRGKKYFKQGAVIDLVKIGKNKWSAIVEGSEEYGVEITLVDKNIVKDWYCDCPYDGGNVCKHVVAVLFDLKDSMEEFDEDEAFELEEVLEVKPKAEPKPIPTSIPKNLPTLKIKDEVDEIISKLSYEQLVMWFKKSLTINKIFKSEFLNDNVDLISLHSFESFKKLLETFIKSYNVSGYKRLTSSETKELALKVDKLLKDAKSKNTSPDGLKVYTALCIEIVKKLGDFYEKIESYTHQYTDLIKNTITELKNLSSEKSTPILIVEEIQRFFISEYAYKKNQKYYEKFSIPEVLINSIRHDGHAKTLIDVFKKEIAKEENLIKNGNRYYPHSDAELQNNVLNVIKILEKENRLEEADAFFNLYTHLPQLKLHAIEKAFKAKDFERVQKLSLEGIERDGHKQDLLDKWSKWLLKAQSEIGDKIEYAENLEILFLNKGIEEYYAELKKILTNSGFSRKVNDWINFFEEEKNLDTLRKIYIDNKLWKELFMNLVPPNSDVIDLDALSEYDKYFEKPYKEEVCLVYEKNIDGNVTNTSAANYAKLCSYLPRIAALGGKERMKNFALTLKKKYASRPKFLAALAPHIT